jgi:hypothetical protein
MRFVDLKNVRAKPWKLPASFPDYDAAKYHEDREVAPRLVKNLLSSQENKKQLKALKDAFPGAIIVPVRAIDAGGKNRIPEMLAEYTAKYTGLQVDSAIVQVNAVHRAGSDPWYRFAFRRRGDRFTIPPVC